LQGLTNKLLYAFGAYKEMENSNISEHWFINAISLSVALGITQSIFWSLGIDIEVGFTFDYLISFVGKVALISVFYYLFLKLFSWLYS